jgi:hypothetical protein
MEALVENLINGVLERSPTSRMKVGQLIGQLLNQHILLRKQFETGLRTVLDIADIMVVDVPKLWDYLGELIGTFIVVFLFQKYPPQPGTDVMILIYFRPRRDRN